MPGMPAQQDVLVLCSKGLHYYPSCDFIPFCSIAIRMSFLVIRLLRGANVLSLYIVMYSIITKLVAESASHHPHLTFCIALSWVPIGGKERDMMLILPPMTLKISERGAGSGPTV